ncbi:MAG TPA: hypothetical protein VFU21_00890 [Kofleriaceae bacterium]|nr:hypothetical protein [Kofleriaceae bacterium]
MFTIRLTLVGALALAGCTSSTADDGTAGEAEEIASAVELENGGLTMDDEAPRFGDPQAFEEAAIEPDRAVDDAMADDPATTAALDAPGAALFSTAVVWGQMPPDFENRDGHEWDGTISINRGAMIVRRRVGFEDVTDQLAPRSDRLSVSFRSITLPHVDGLLLTIVDPEPTAADPLTVTYTAASGTVFSATMAELVSGPQSVAVDDSGNRMVATAMREPADPCAHGTLRGRWHRVADGRGRLIGVVADPEGETIGHLRGVYGRKRNGEQVFFGKYIDRDGRFQGLFGGHYEDGSFAGRWIVRPGLDHGLLAGMYRETIEGPETGGLFIGRWAETSCNLRLDR